MKKILLRFICCGIACFFGIIIYLGLSNRQTDMAAYLQNAIFPVLAGLLGFGAFFLKKPYRMLAPLFIFWLIGFFISLGSFPPGFSFFNPSGWYEAFHTVQNRHDLFKGFIYLAWSLFGMAQVFIKQPPRDNIIIVHGFLTVFVAGLWRIPLYWLGL